MVIQRLQSLLLFLAAVILVLLCFTIPIGIDASSEAEPAVFVKDSPGLLIFSLTVTALLVVTIFLYKNLKLQMRVTLLCILLMFVVLGLLAYVMTCQLQSPCEALWIGAFSFMVVCIALCVWAYRRMQADDRLLRSYDRLR